MRSKGSQDEYQGREAELQEREQALRLREIEAELTQKREAEIEQNTETVRMQSRQTALGRWRRKFSVAAKLFVLFVVAIVGITLGKWIAIAVVVGAVGWLGYKAFFDGDMPRE